MRRQPLIEKCPFKFTIGTNSANLFYALLASVLHLRRNFARLTLVLAANGSNIVKEANIRAPARDPSPLITSTLTDVFERRIAAARPGLSP